MEARITELEIKLGLSEDHLEELNRTVFRQQQQIDLLQAQIRELYLLMNRQAPVKCAIRATKSRRTIETGYQRPAGALSTPVMAYPGPTPRLLNQPRFISRAYRAGLTEQ